MCRTPALVATVLALAAGPVLAVEAPKPAKDVATATATATAPAVAAPPAAVKATPQQRAEARRLDPFARAAFWASQLEVDGRDIEAGLGVTQAMRQMGRYEEAADAAARALIIAPDNLDLLLESARAQIGRGQGFYAIEPAKKAQALAPRDWRPVSLLAVATEQAGRDDEALAYHRQALALAPNEPAVLSNMGMYYAGHGDLPRAEQMLRQAAASGRADAKVRQNLALVIGLQGRVAEAEQLVRQDLPPDQAANNVAWLKAATERAPTGQGRSWDAMRGSGS
ncbi:tetratricopeptide repeat protein [Caulobacter mirabilis]|uniref:Pilus assembly protein TadD n=1 Tax=Caulobacter mirabilis TaxID=69666 RepID=A0A2D2B2A8_9CAUL|nr:tetratricopeptide repeat protein [Caulobacter mirabilis]ATQ44357.1 pilus assembly protein TadD [Caulobacter mirabilis]